MKVPAGQVIMVGVSAMFFLSSYDFSLKLVIMLMRDGGSGLHA